MDANGLSSDQAARNEQLQRLLKQFELEAHSSLRGPAVLGAAVFGGGSPSSAAVVSGSVSIPSTTTTAGAADTLYETTAAHHSSSSSSTATSGAAFRKVEIEAPVVTISSKHSRGNGGKGTTTVDGDQLKERILAVDRSVMQHQDALLKEILNLKGVIPVQQLPALSIRDRTPAASERKDTLLEGEIITCFVVGGEKRLCFPQVLNTVLKSVPMVDINQACSELNIHCGHCTPEQLLALKIAGVVAATTASCALITKTDAERLCDYLLRQRRIYRAVSSFTADKKNRTAADRRHLLTSAASSGIRSVAEVVDRSTPLLSSSSRPHMYESSGGPSNVKRDTCISVTHYCFGRCRGRYFQSLYASPSAECIECSECRQLLAPDRFVVHSHGHQERRTCHWGFDSANWRAYVHLSKDNECEENSKILEQMKLRFDVSGLTKRRLEQDPPATTSNQTKDAIDLDGPHHQCSKRSRLDLPEQQPQAQQQLRKPVAEPSTAAFSKGSNAKSSTGMPLSAAPPTFDQSAAGLPYFMCDPVFLASYCQPALQNLLSSCFAAAIRAAAAQAESGANIVPPSSSLPSLPAASLAQLVAQQQQQPFLQRTPAAAAATAAASNPLHGHHNLQSKGEHSSTSNRNAPLDEATAVAALKLLQLHGGGNVQLDAGLFHGLPQDNEKKMPPTDVKNEKDMQDLLVKRSSQQQQQSSSLPFGKEPFKKQLLHLFAVEQQQKEVLLQQQQRLHDDSDQRNELPKRTDLVYGRSVEMIADNKDTRRQQQQRVHASTPLYQQPPVSGVQSDNKQPSEPATPDTQVAEELSVSSSDNEGASGHDTLDDLLRQYIKDASGLKLVRSKIAENQRYLEQKLDSVCAENRLLYGEFQQLRLNLLQQQQQQHHHRHKQTDAGANILASGGETKNFNAFLPKHFVL